MPQGLQVWDADGSILLDTNTDTVNILGAFRGPVNTTIRSPLFLTERFFYAVHPPQRYPDARSGGGFLIDVSLTGDTCRVINKIQNPADSSDAISVIIGVY